jgi:membrane associated rhomboid family serine protease
MTMISKALGLLGWLKTVSGGRSSWVLGTLLVFWAVEILKYLGFGRLTANGIRPRNLEGLWGIFYAPFLHADFGHLIANSVAFVPLALLVSARKAHHFFSVTLMVMLCGGAAVWLLGRSANHIGASGLIFGYLGFLLGAGFFAREFSAVAIAGVAAFFYGGILWGVLPGRPGVSWEAHFFGAIAGVIASKILR